MPIPEGPLFIVSQKPCFIDLESEVKTRTGVSRLALVRNSDFDSLAFDAAGTLWNFKYERPTSGFSAFTRFLTHTFYNPVLQVTVIWTAMRPYYLDELRQHYLDAIAADDDSLTQFVESDELCARVRACSSFQDFLATWEWQNTDHAFDDDTESNGNA